MTMPRAGQIYRCGRRHVRIEQVRSTGGSGARYALARLCTREGEPKRHRFLTGRRENGEPYNIPINIFLMQTGEMPPGYVLKGD